MPPIAPAITAGTAAAPRPRPVRLARKPATPHTMTGLSATPARRSHSGRPANAGAVPSTARTITAAASTDPARRPSPTAHGTGSESTETTRGYCFDVIADLRALVDRRELLVDFAWRELRARYKGSVLGFAWNFVNPLLQLIVFWLLFGVVLRTRPVTATGEQPYAIFLFVGLLPRCAAHPGDPAARVVLPHAGALLGLGARRSPRAAAPSLSQSDDRGDRLVPTRAPRRPTAAVERAGVLGALWGGGVHPRLLVLRPRQGRLRVGSLI